MLITASTLWSANGMARASQAMYAGRGTIPAALVAADVTPTIEKSIPISRTPVERARTRPGPPRPQPRSTTIWPLASRAEWISDRHSFLAVCVEVTSRDRAATAIHGAKSAVELVPRWRRRAPGILLWFAWDFVA